MRLRPSDTHCMHDALAVVLDAALGAVPKGLPLRGAVRLGSCSRAWWSLVRDKLTAHPMLWIVAALSQGTSDAVSWVASQVQQLGWQPRPEQLAALVRTPIQWLDDVQALVRGGARPSYAQLLAAAAEGVKGVRLWARACVEQGLLPGCPAAVAALCCRLPLQDVQLDPTTAVDACLFALDCTHVTAAQLQRLAASLTPHQLQQLLTAAIQRQQPGALQALRSVPAAVQLSGQQLGELIQAAVAAPVPDLLRHILQLPAAAALAAGRVLPLLTAAVQRSRREEVAALAGLPGAQQLTALHVLGLLRGAEAVPAGPGGNMGCLARLPAAAALTGDQLLPLVTSLVAQGRQEGVAGQGKWADLEVLRRLPGVQQLTGDQVLGLLRAAAAAPYHVGIATAIVQLRGAAAMTGEQLLPLLATAVCLDASDGQVYRKLLYNLPGVQQLSGDQVEGLMHTADAWSQRVLKEVLGVV